MSDHQLKLQIAGQCLAGILANSSPYYIGEEYEQLAKFAWDCATELMALSKKEDDEENARVVADWHRHLKEKEEEKKIKKRKVVQIVKED